MTKQFERLAVLLGVLSIVACGDSSVSPAPDAGPDATADTGSKGDSAASTSNPDAGGMAPQPIQCGTNMCNPPMSALGGLAGGLPGGGGMGGMMAGRGGMMGGAGGLVSACCLSDGGCGGGLGMLGALGGGGGGGGDGGATCLDTSMGKPDPSCASVPTPLGIALSGCCSNNNVCGADLSILGLGCNSPSVFGGLLMMGDSGPPRPCGDAGGTSASGEGGAGDGGDAGTADSAADSAGQDAAHE